MKINTLIRIKNALSREHERLKVPYSKADLAVLDVLTECGFIESASKKGRGVKKIIDIKLKYNERKPAISGIKLISKPSRRIYLGYKDIKRSRDGYGYYIISTPQGILTDVEARKNKVGGEMLFEIW